MSEPDEITRLQAEITRLRAEVDRGRAVEPEPAPAAGERTGVWRPIVVTVLLVLVGLLAPLSVVAAWAHDEISDTDRYVETVTPLASDPAVQHAIADRVTAEIFARLDVKAITQDAVDALSARGLPPRASASLSALATPLANGVESFVHKQVLRLVQTPQFEQAWIEANRAAHGQMVAVLTGKTGGSVEVKGNAVQVNLAAVIETVKKQLEEARLRAGRQDPDRERAVHHLQSATCPRPRTRSGCSVRRPGCCRCWRWCCRRRCRDRPVTPPDPRGRGAGGRGSMVLLGLALNVFRRSTSTPSPPTSCPPTRRPRSTTPSAQFIRLNLRAVLVSSSWWPRSRGSSGRRRRRAVRNGTTHALDVVRHGSDRAGLRHGPVGRDRWT